MGLVYVASLGALVGGVARVYRCVHPASARCRRHGGSWIRLLLRVLALGICVSASTYTGAFSAVIASQANSCFLQQDGTMKCWGANTNGQLNVPSGQFVEVAAGNNGGCGSQHAYVCGLRASGTALCWGEAGCGVTTVPTAVFSHLTTSNAFVCGLTVAGSIQCWGRNDTSQLSAPAGTNFVQVAAGVVKSCALTTSGSLSCWGDPGNTFSEQLTPPAGAPFIDVCVGFYHACVLKSDGSAVCFGSNALGQLNSPSGVFVQLDCKWDFTCAVTPLNTTVCWGANANLQCNVPPGLSMRMVSTGRWHACGVLTTGGIACWGVPPGDVSGIESVPPGAVAIAVCAAGSAGSGNGTCSSCRDGTFSLTAASTCLQCTCSPGYAHASTRSIACVGSSGNCVACGVGYFSTGGAAQCAGCSAGYYGYPGATYISAFDYTYLGCWQDDGARTLTQWLIMSGASGASCAAAARAAGAKYFGLQNGGECWASARSDEAAWPRRGPAAGCAALGGGMTNQVYVLGNAYAQATCIGQCMPGYFCPAGSTSPTGAPSGGACTCAPGSYCPSGSPAATGTLCPAGSSCAGAAAGAGA